MAPTPAARAAIDALREALARALAGLGPAERLRVLNALDLEVAERLVGVDDELAAAAGDPRD